MMADGVISCSSPLLYNIYCVSSISIPWFESLHLGRILKGKIHIHCGTMFRSLS